MFPSFDVHESIAFLTRRSRRSGEPVQAHRHRAALDLQSTRRPHPQQHTKLSIPVSACLHVQTLKRAHATAGPNSPASPSYSRTSVSLNSSIALWASSAVVKSTVP
eukprot:scaffold704_cov347-Prasinococcus_capsulatus_cf.AAC.5